MHTLTASRIRYVTSSAKLSPTSSGNFEIPTDSAHMSRQDLGRIVYFVSMLYLTVYKA